MAARGPFGAGEAQLTAIAAELRYLATGYPVSQDLLHELAATARPMAPMVRAAILNTPSAGGVPYKQEPGLRARIASCVVPWAQLYTDTMTVSVGVEVDASRMPDGQKALPLYLDGIKPRWRHPLFGKDPWQDQEAHPYFAEATEWYGPAARRAIDRVLDKVTERLSIT